MPNTTDKYITLKAPTGHEIKYSVRNKRFLLIQTNFNPLNFKPFFESRLIAATGIKQLESIGMYDDGPGYIIFSLKVDTDRDILYNEIQSIFKTYFLDKQID